MDSSNDSTTATITPPTTTLEHALTQRPCLETVEPASFVEGPWGPSLGVQSVGELTSEATDVFPTVVVTVPGTDTVLIGDRDGAVWAMADGEPPLEVLDLREVTTYEGDGGLLNLAIDGPRGVLYVLRTAEEGATTLTSHPLPADGLDVGEGTEILRVERPGAMHAGGALVALADGSVLVGIGDGGGLGGPEERAQQLDGLLGKLLRIEPRVGEEPPYVVPADSPGLRSPSDDPKLALRPEILALGLRNPYRADLDEASGRLYLPDVGQSCREEVNVTTLDPFVTRNYGWPMWEGTHRFKPEGSTLYGHTPPTYDYLAGCAIIGGFVYHGTAIPGLEGRYLFGDWCEGWIRALTVDASGQVRIFPVAEVESPTSISEGPGGEPWITTATDGIHRLVPGEGAAPSPEDGANPADPASVTTAGPDAGSTSP
jgi:hypothetical protein